MAVDPQAPPGPEKAAGSPIENEIPTYRAISPMAITSFLLGLLSVVTFASPVFLLAGVGAVVTGALARRKIRRMPDMLTGGGFAQVGIALGIIFSLSALTFTTVRDFRVRREAEAFARSYAQVLASRDLADSHWYQIHPMQRQGSTPGKALAELESQSLDGAPIAEEARLGPLKAAFADLEGAGSSIRFVEIEQAGYDDLTPYAFAILEVQAGHPSDDHDGHDLAHDGHDHAHDDHDHAHDDHDHAHDDHDHAHDDHAHDDHDHPTKYMLLYVRSNPDAAGFDWYIEEIRYPYERRSHAIPQKPVDDGHGHAH